MNHSGGIRGYALPQTLAPSSRTPYNIILDTLNTAVSTTQNTLDLSSIQTVLLRKNAQTYVQSLLQTNAISVEEKIQTLNDTIQSVESRIDLDLTDRQYGTLQYLLRLFHSKKTYLLPSMQIGQVLI